MSEVRQFTRRTGIWVVELLPGWDAIEDLMGAALISSQPIEEVSRFRASVNVVELSGRLPQDLHMFAREQAAAIAADEADVLDLYGLPAGHPLRQPGVLVAGIVVRHTSPGFVVLTEQVWADANLGALAFTITADQNVFDCCRQELLSVPRSLVLL